MLLRESFTRMPDPDQRPDTGASYRQSKREMFWMLGTWAVFFIWVNGYCSLNAYSTGDERPLQLVLGFPSWVFYGWVLPLMAANAFTFWFCLRYMKDEPMEDLPQEDEMEGEDA
ncbi:MAG: DUF997 family protein [Verrucomicrobiota bacterium]|nr:DUF997 family protein [Verrucomicrobiota bacterium]